MVQPAARRGEVSSFGAPAEPASLVHTPLGPQFSVRQELNSYTEIQGRAEKWAPGLVNFVPAVA